MEHVLFGLIDSIYPMDIYVNKLVIYNSALK